jgi:steroid 5-alpha reductase family enzyme
MKQKHFIDSHKGATAFFILFCMYCFDGFQSPTLWLYLATHGTYGFLWIWKSRVFPDKQWEQSASIWYGLYIWAGLSLYWITPFIIASQKIEAPAWLMGLSVMAYSFGVFLHFTSDMQKHVQLALKPGLFQDGLWATNRNPNYLGEFLIYAGFGALAYQWVWIPWSVLALFMLIVWFPNMKKKDQSLSRHDGFTAYKQSSVKIFPFLY